MLIKNLSELKKRINENRPFYIHNHRVEAFIGQVRIAHIKQTNGVYLWVYNDPNNRVTLANNGKGSWLEYGKASMWRFDTVTGHCYLYNGNHIDDNLIMEISFFDDECIEGLNNKKR